MTTRTESANLVGYRAADQTHAFDYQRGVVQLPVAARTPATRLIRLHGGMGQRIVSFRFVREGKPPIIPTMADTSGDTILAARVSPATPTPSSTGKGMDWVVTGEYVYAQNDPRIVGTHAIPVGQLPYTDQTLLAEAENAAPPSVVNAYAINVLVNPALAFQTFVQNLAGSTTVNALGDYSWPFFAIPIAFSSDHIIQD